MRYYIDPNNAFPPIPISELSERNYWRRLIAAHLASFYRDVEDIDGEPCKHFTPPDVVVQRATNIVDELERIEKLEAGENTTLTKGETRK